MQPEADRDKTPNRPFFLEVLVEVLGSAPRSAESSNHASTRIASFASLYFHFDIWTALRDEKNSRMSKSLSFQSVRSVGDAELERRNKAFQTTGYLRSGSDSDLFGRSRRTRPDGLEVSQGINLGSCCFRRFVDAANRRTATRDTTFRPTSNLFHPHEL